MLTHAWELGRILGFRIRVHASLIVIFGLIAVSLALGLLPAWHPDWSAAMAWGVSAIAAASFLASILVHELAHSVVARAFGIPVQHITLFLFGGVSGMEREPPDPVSEFLVAVVGPLTSIGLGAAFLWLARTFGAEPVFASDRPLAALTGIGPAPTLLLWLGPVNVFVGLFNLLPGFPLDGGRLLRAGLWYVTGDLVLATRWATAGGVGLGLLFLAAGLVMAVGIPIPVLGHGLVGGLWLVLIGWFLRRSARSALEHTLLIDALSEVVVARLMDPEPAMVPAGLDLPRFAVGHLLGGEDTVFAVVREGVVVGVLHARAVERVPAEAWDTTRVDDLAVPLDELPSVAPDTPASEVLGAFVGHETPVVTVQDAGRLVGVLHLRDLLRWAAWRDRELPAGTPPAPGAVSTVSGPPTGSRSA